MTLTVTHVAELACDPAEEFGRHQAWLRTVLIARLGNREEADEALQEVALAAATQSAKQEPIARVGPWLYRVALRQVLLLRRKQGRRRRLMANAAVHLLAIGPDSASGSPLDWVLSEERRQIVERVMALLCERDRQLLLLKYVDGLSYEDIAGVLGVTMRAVQSRLHRARKQLRQRLLTTQDGDHSNS